MTARVAFFDVDGTLTRVNGMFRFLGYVLSRAGRPGEYDRIVGHIRSLAAAGTPREQTNRVYFRSYLGYRLEWLRRLGREWFELEAARDGFFDHHAVAELKRHQAEGALVVFVSGSFEPCLDPVAEYLGVSRIACTQPEIVAGRLTGVVRTPLIGAAKAAAVRQIMDQVGVAGRDCAAYGDHVSDVPMLAAVGRAVVVGTDPQLLGHADRRGWQRLTAPPAGIG